MARPITFTVVTPSFNQGPFIEDTLRSVRAQVHPHVEHIVVDALSTDDTPAILDRYRDQLTAVIQEKDDGQSDAINKGFRRATGDVIAWLNADDYYFPRALTKAALAFDHDPALDVLYGDCVYTGARGQFLRYFTEVRPFDKAALLNHSNYIMQPSCFFRRSTVEKLGLLRAELRYTMDWDLWCRLAHAGAKFQYLPNLLSANREHGSTKTLSGGRERQREIRRIHRKHRTSLVPWAAISFALGERLKRLGNYDHGSWVYRYARRGKRLLRREPHNHLYGLEAHGSRLDHQFRIRFPYYREPATTVAVELHYRAPRRAKVSPSLMLDVGDHLHEQRLTPDVPTHIELPLPQPFKHDVDILGSYTGDGALHLRRTDVVR